MTTKPKAKPQTTDPAIADYLAQLLEQYGEHVLAAEEVRKIVDEAMGDVSLSDAVLKIRKEQA